MEIKVLQDLAVKEVEAMLASSGSHEQQKLERRRTQKKVIDRVRKNLWTLTCQADVVEMTGVLADFGGEKDVEGSIARAIFGLLCFGAIHGVHVSQRLEALAAELRAKHKLPATVDETSQSYKTEERAGEQATPESPQEETMDTSDSQGQKTDESAAPSAGDLSSPDTDAPPANDRNGSASLLKEERIKLHERSLRDAKSRQDLDRVWRQNVTTDKALEGTDKAPLYQVYKECRNSLKAA